MTPKPAADRMSQYLSVEWEVTQETAANIAEFVEGLVTGLAAALSSIDQAQKDGDLQRMSNSVTAVMQLLNLVPQAVERTESNSYAHYVELLGDREEVLNMAGAIYEFFAPRQEEEGAVRPGSNPDIDRRFDALLRDLNDEELL